MQTVKAKEQSKTTGTVRVKRYRPGTLDAAAPFYAKANGIRAALNLLHAGGQPPSAGLIAALEGMIAAAKAEAQAILEAGYVETAIETRNLVVSSDGYGRNLIAQRLGGTNTYSLNITHADIGTGTTNPANSDTDLETGVTRGALQTADIANNVVTLRFFYSDGNLANGSYTEFGTFVDGSASLGTGQLFNHALFSSAYVKASGQDTTIEVEFDIN